MAFEAALRLVEFRNQCCNLLILQVFKIDKRFQRIDKRKTLRDVFQSLGIELELLFVPAKLEG